MSGTLFRKFPRLTQAVTGLAAVTMLAAAGCKMHEEREAEQVYGFGQAPQAVERDEAMQPGMTTTTMAFPTGERQSSTLLVTKRMPRQVRLGQPFTYYVEVTNLTDQPMEQVVVFDQPGLTQEQALAREGEPRPGVYGFGRTPDQQLAEPARGGQWQIGRLAGGESKTVRVQAVAREPGELYTCTTVSYQPTLCMTASVVNPELEIERLAPDEILACEELEVRYRIRNVGTGTAEDITVREDLPQGWSLAQQAGEQVRLDLATLPEGETREMTVRIDPVDEADQYAGQAIVETAFGDTCRSDQTTTRLVRPVLDLTVDGPEEVYAGEPATYNIQLRNTGDGVARDLTVRHELPSGAELLEAEGQPRQVGDALVWQLDPLEPDEQRSLSATLTTNQPEQIEAQVTADAFCAEQVSGQVMTQFQGLTSLLVELVDTNDPVQVGETETYDIIVTNQGSIPAENVRIVATVPSELSVVDTRSPVEPQQQADQMIFAVPRLGAEDSVSIQIRARAQQAGDVRFQIQVSSDTVERPVMETEATRLY
ncbi:MAG: COG1361 S-layer family protein [Phycisphaeraceae bacterium]